MSQQVIFCMLIRMLVEKIQSEDFLNEFRMPKRFVRNRELSMEMIVKFLFYKHNTTIASAWDTVRKQFGNCELPQVTAQSVSKARGGILPELFQALFDASVTLYYRLNESHSLWRDKYRLFAIDGSEYDLPAHKTIRDEFGVHSDPKNPEYKWSQGLGSVMYDVGQDIIIDAVLGVEGSNERDLAMRHIARAKELGLFDQDNAIVIFDRGYYSSEMFQACLQADCNCLMRVSAAVKIFQRELDDDIVEVPAPDDDETIMNVRVLKVLLPTGEIERLVTNIMDDKLTCEDFREMYFNRWQIEKKYYEAKEFWKIEEFSGHTSSAVRQDFYINMILMNLAAIVKTTVDEKIRKAVRATNRYRYQARRTYIVGRIATQVYQWLSHSEGTLEKELEELISQAAQQKSQIKDGRSSSRKKKNRARKHYNNKRSAI